MNKKVNYVLFIIAATAVNIIIMLLLYIIPFLLLILIFGNSINSVMPIISLVILPIFSIAGAYFIYSKIYKYFRQKVDMEKYFEPILKRRKY